MSLFIDCFEGLIGVQSCSVKQVQFDIARLPGISIESIEKIRDADTQTFLDAINDVIFRAVYRLKGDLSKSIKTSGMQSEICIGRLDDAMILVPASTGFGGIMLKMMQSQYLLITIDSLKFFTDGIYTIDFLVHDMTTGTLLETINFQTQAGENEIPVNLTLLAQRYDRQISITYDLSTAPYMKSSALPCFDGCSCSCPVALTCGCNSFTGLYENVKSFTTFGLAASFRIECSFEKFICNNISKLGEALWYAAGIEYFDELKGSPALNKFTKTKAEDYQILRNSLKSKYTKAIESGLQSLNLTDNCCFQCDSEIYKFHYVRP